MTTNSSSPSDQDQPYDLAIAYRDLQKLLITTSELDAFLGELAALAVDVIATMSACGITLRREGKPTTVTSSDALALRIDELQYGGGVGPCLQALHTGQIVTVSDLATEQRWGDFPSHALSSGVAASLSVPLTAGEATIGAMNLYSVTAHEFSAGEISQATAFAAQASGALTLVERHESQLKVNAQLLDALASRSIIDQAMGVLMGTRHISATEAFDALRSQSQRRNIKLHAVATDLVELMSKHAAEPAPAFSRRG